MRKKKTLKIWFIIIIIACALLAATGMYLGCNTAYQNGIHEGEKTTLEAMSARIQALGEAVAAKTSIVKELDSLSAESTTLINTETITSYIEKLNTLINSTNDETIQKPLQDYLSAWESFKETYASENNNAITSAFNELKTTADNTATQLKSTYDAKITTAINEL